MSSKPEFMYNNGQGKVLSGTLDVVGKLLDEQARLQQQIESLTENKTMNDDLLIPVQVGFEQADLTRESIHTLVAALEDWCDGEMPADLEKLCRLLSGR